MRGAMIAGKCWVRAQEGADALCASWVGVNEGYVVQCRPEYTFIGGGPNATSGSLWLTVVKTALNGSGTSVSTYVNQSFFECQYFGRDEYIGIGSIVFLGVLALIMLRKLRHMFSTRETV